MAEAMPAERPLKHPVRYRAEGVAAWLLFRVFRALPLDAASVLGALVATVFAPFMTGANRRARRHLALAMPELTGDQRRRIIAAMWRNLGRTFAELAHLDALGRSTGPEPRIEFVGTEHVDQAARSDSAVLFFSAHLGNWECLPFLDPGPDRSRAVVHREANNPFVERLLARARQATAAELVAKGPSGARRLLQQIKNNNVVGMLVDQKLNDGIAVPFFGRKAMTAPALAQFALHYGLPVLPVRCERLQGAHLRITISPPLAHPDSGNRDGDVLAMMTEVNRIIEEWVRATPEQWLWFHRRWPNEGAGSQLL